MSFPFARRARGSRAAVAFFAAAAALTAATTADAISDRVKVACKADYNRLCPGYKVGSSSLRACMEAKQGDISGRCVDALIDSGEVDREQGRKHGRR